MELKDLAWKLRKVRHWEEKVFFFFLTLVSSLDFSISKKTVWRKCEIQLRQLIHMSQWIYNIFVHFGKSMQKAKRYTRLEDDELIVQKVCFFFPSRVAVSTECSLESLPTSQSSSREECISTKTLRKAHILITQYKQEKKR